MNLLLDILLLANVSAILIAVSRFCISRQGLEINHVMLFSVGFLTYWILPVGIGILHLIGPDLLTQVWAQTYTLIPQATLAIYLTVTLGCYLSFGAGCEAAHFLCRRSPSQYRTIFFFRSLLSIPFYFGVGFCLLLAFLLRAKLFQGYGNPADWDTSQGTFNAFAVFLLSIAFISVIKKNEETKDTLPFRKVVIGEYFLTYFFFALLILSMGGRLYFFSSLVMLITYFSVYFKRLRIKSAAILLVSLLAFAGLAGLVRQSRGLEAQGFLVNLLSEPILTSLSLLRFLQDNTWEAFRLPIFLLSDFIALIPTALFPSKFDFEIDPANYGYVIFSPAGAENSFLSFMINFGFLGTMGVLFLLGFFLNYLKEADRNLLHRVIYVMFCGWLGFTFFRDPFSISVVKNMVEFSLLLPTLVVILLQFLSLYLRNERRAGNEEDSVEAISKT